MLTHADIRNGLGDALQRTLGPGSVAVERAVADSRLCRTGDLFVALPGESLDGNDYVEDAFARGAAAALAERPPATLPDGCTVYLVDRALPALQRLAGWWRARFSPRVIAITGTVGKTSTKEIAAHVLATRATVLRTEASLNGDIGLPLMLLRLRPEHEVAVLELGLYYAGEITLQCDLAQPRFGIVTNVGHTHAERLGTIAAIAAAKRELVEWMPDEGMVALNADDPRVAAMAAPDRCRVVTYGLSPGAEIRGDAVQDLGLDGFTFRMHAHGQTVPVHTPLIGRHNVHNCLAAAAVALADGMTPAEVAEALATANNPLRLQRLPGPNGSTLIDDTYNANPASMNAALDLLEAIPATGGRRIAVLGDMAELGPEEEWLHRALGERAARTADLLILTGGRSRWTAEAARLAGGADVRYVDHPGRLAAAVLAEAGPGDVILLKASRSMAFERVVEALLAARDIEAQDGPETAVVASHPIQ
ncbi:MAG: UDP-N-acetylmuramoyl-tripeptide--D-alanyl-D-alanine ligase [Dehalococcoidia bacterium]